MSDDDDQSINQPESSDSRRPNIYPSLHTARQQAATTDEAKLKGPSTQLPSVKSSNKRASSGMSSSKKGILVYIPDIPSNLAETNLEQTLQTRLESSARVKVQEMKCYPTVGIAVIQLSKKEDKEHLVSNVQSMVLDPQRGINISFVKELEFDSYIVLDRQSGKIPSGEEVAHHYMQAYNLQEIPTCHLVSVVFPNIFRVVSKSLDDLITIAGSTNISIKNISATVYPHAECTFFEDLPSNTTDRILSSAITSQIGETDLSESLFYVRFDKKTGNAVVVASKSVQKWIIQGFLTINGRNVSKKVTIACRVLVSPVPPHFDINLILDHQLFAGHVTLHTHLNNHPFSNWIIWRLISSAYRWELYG